MVWNGGMEEVGDAVPDQPHAEPALDAGVLRRPDLGHPDPVREPDHRWKSIAAVSGGASPFSAREMATAKAATWIAIRAM